MSEFVLKTQRCKFYQGMLSAKKYRQHKLDECPDAKLSVFAMAVGRRWRDHAVWLIQLLANAKAAVAPRLPSPDRLPVHV